MLRLENRFLKKLEEGYGRPDLFEPIEWDRVNEIIDRRTAQGLAWLKNALESGKNG
jgi:hypothetical protein